MSTKRSFRLFDRGRYGGPLIGANAASGARPRVSAGKLRLPMPPCGVSTGKLCVPVPPWGILLVMLLVSVALCGGCGFSQGQLLWAMGFGSGVKVKAEFELTPEGSVLILVDDPEERLYSPATRSELAEKLGKGLEAHDAVGRVVPQSGLQRLRREKLDYEEITCRQIGEMVEADEVLWVQVRDFYAEPEVDETISAARMAVAVKVIDVHAKQRAEVRLWPVDREGRIVSTELHANEVIRAKTPEAISRRLTEKVAGEVGKLFYEHPLEEE